MNNSNRTYSGDIDLSSNFTLHQSRPLDDRLSLRTQAALFDTTTWSIGNNNILTRYSGIVTAVVADSTTTNNGVYWLPKSAKFDKQSWDSSNVVTYDIDGWRKLLDNTSVLQPTAYNLSISYNNTLTPIYNPFVNTASITLGNNIRYNQAQIDSEFINNIQVMDGAALSADMTSSSYTIQNLDQSLVDSSAMYMLVTSTFGKRYAYTIPAWSSGSGNFTGATTLGGLTDVTLNGSQNGDVLTYNNGVWVNQSITIPTINDELFVCSFECQTNIMRGPTSPNPLTATDIWTEIVAGKLIACEANDGAAYYLSNASASQPYLPITFTSVSYANSTCEIRYITEGPNGTWTHGTTTNQVNADWDSISGASQILNKPELFSGDYNDLTNKPTIPAAQVNSDWNASSGIAEILNKPNFATVATTGSYNDLSNKPTIPTVPTNVSAFTNDAGYITASDVPQEVFVCNFTETNNVISCNKQASDIIAARAANKAIVGILNNEIYYCSWASSLQIYFFSSTFDSNGNKIRYIKWTESSNFWTRKTVVYQEELIGSGTCQNIKTINNESLLGSGNITVDGGASALNDLSDVTISLATDEDVLMYDTINGEWINKQLGSVAISNSYNDLTDKPTIPSAQVNADWEATSGAAEILHKPNLANVATSGSYTDLINQPTIPTVPTNISSFNNDVGYIINQQQSDWAETDNASPSYIKSKPNLATVATSGDYRDLLNTPTIPTIPTNISSFTNDSGYLTQNDLNVFVCQYNTITGQMDKTVSEIEAAYIANKIVICYVDTYVLYLYCIRPNFNLGFIQKGYNQDLILDLIYDYADQEWRLNLYPLASLFNIDIWSKHVADNLDTSYTITVGDQRQCVIVDNSSNTVDVTITFLASANSMILGGSVVNTYHNNNVATRVQAGDIVLVKAKAIAIGSIYYEIIEMENSAPSH